MAPDQAAGRVHCEIRQLVDRALDHEQAAGGWVVGHPARPGHRQGLADLERLAVDDDDRPWKPWPGALGHEQPAVRRIESQPGRRADRDLVVDPQVGADHRHLVGLGHCHEQALVGRVVGHGFRVARQVDARQEGRRGSPAVHDGDPAIGLETDEGPATVPGDRQGVRETPDRDARHDVNVRRVAGEAVDHGQLTCAGPVDNEDPTAGPTAVTPIAPGKTSLSAAWPIWPTRLLSLGVVAGGGPLPKPPKVQPGAGFGGTTPGGFTTGALDGNGLGAAATEAEGTGVWRANVNVPERPFVSWPVPISWVPSAETIASLVATYEAPFSAAVQWILLPVTVPARGVGVVIGHA